LAMQDIAKILLVILPAITMPVTAVSSRHSVVVYFNGGCYSCLDYVERLEYALRAAGVTSIVRYDYYANRTALGDLSSLREKLNVPKEFIGSVTTIVDGRYVFEGFFPIDIMISFIDSSPGLDKLILAQGLRPDSYRLLRGNIIVECNSPERVTDCLSSGTLISALGIWAIVLVSGFVNGLNPCALAVLAYFIGALSVHRSRIGTLRIGAFYILSIYLVYLGIGTGLMHAMLLSGLVQEISRALGAFIVAVAVLSLLSAFQRDSEFLPKIPRRLILPIARRFSRSWVHKSAIIAALLFGGIVAALEFPCTGGVYAAIVGMLSLRADLDLIPYLLGYNFMFAMPLAILLIFSCSIANFPLLRDKMEKHKHLTRLASGLLMLGLGTLLWLY